jgi:hypothetical protein
MTINTQPAVSNARLGGSLTLRQVTRSFFEPAPPPREPEYHWASPAWDRPSEGSLPCLVPSNVILHKSDEAVLGLASLRVFTNGFEMDFAILANPYRHHRVRTLRSGSRGFVPRVGVHFSDGRNNGPDGQRLDSGLDCPKDSDGFPLDPVVRYGCATQGAKGSGASLSERFPPACHDPGRANHGTRTGRDSA